MLVKLKELLAKYRQFLLYCVVGVANTLITMAVLTLLFDVLHWPHWLAYAISYAAGVVNGFFWSTKTVFRTKGTAANLTKFIAVNLFTLGLNVLLMWVFVDNLHIQKLIAQAFVLPFTFIGNYSINKLWTFSDKKKNPPAGSSHA
jgi:putative flippase GtrA